jgi:hypothetical protein
MAIQNRIGGSNGRHLILQTDRIPAGAALIGT